MYLLPHLIVSKVIIENNKTFLINYMENCKTIFINLQNRQIMLQQLQTIIVPVQILPLFVIIIIIIQTSNAFKFLRHFFNVFFDNFHIISEGQYHLLVMYIHNIACRQGVTYSSCHNLVLTFSVGASSEQHTSHLTSPFSSHTIHLRAQNSSVK